MPNSSSMSDARAAKSKEKNNYSGGKGAKAVHMAKTRVGGNPTKSGGINRATQGAGKQH